MLPKLILCALLLSPWWAQAAGDAPALVAQSLVQMKIDPERSRALAEQALQALAARPDADLQVRAHLLLCDYHAERDRSAAQAHIAQGRALVPRLKRAGLGAGFFGCEGDVHEAAGDSARALALYEQQVQAAEKARDSEMLADGLFKRGHLRGVQGEYANGLADLKRAHAVFAKSQLPMHALTVENTIAILYNRMGDYAQARRYLESALRAQTAAGLLREQAVTQYNLGRALENLRDWPGAQRAFEGALKISRELGYPRGQAYAMRGLASVQNARAEPQEALAWLDQAAAQLSAVPDARLSAQLRVQRGIALRTLHRLPESAAALKEALQVFKTADSLAEQATAHEALAATYAEQGDWRAAFEQQRLFKRANDQLLGRQLDERFATLKIEYDTAAREREMVLLQQTQQATERALAQERLAGRWLTVAIALAVVLLALLAALVWRTRRTSVALRGLAMTDELTALPNRRAALTEIEAQLGRSAPRCALLLADIDLFKAINDTHGHLVGDQILRLVAEAVRAVGHAVGHAVGQDTPGRAPCLARFGGEEFVAVLPGATLDEAVAAAQQLRERVAAIDVSRWAPGGRVTISIGVTLMVAGDTLSTLLRRADEALYAAKAAGRNCVMAG